MIKQYHSIEYHLGKDAFWDNDKKPGAWVYYWSWAIKNHDGNCSNWSVWLVPGTASPEDFD